MRTLVLALAIFLASGQAQSNFGGTVTSLCTPN